MTAIDVRMEVGAVTRMLNSIAAQTPKALATGLLRAAQFASGEIRSTLYDETAGRGALARSFKERLIGFQGGDISAESYSTLVYARIQEDGGVIRPKNRRALAVPIKGAKIPAGKWPRHFPAEGPQALHLIPRRGRASLLAQVKRDARGETTSVRPLYVLLPSVTIKPQRYVARTAARIAPRVQAMVADALAGRVRAEGGSDG